RLGCLEMIRTGTTFFNDMYWHVHGTARAAVDAGMRAVLADAFIDRKDPDLAEEVRDRVERRIEEFERYPDRIAYALAPHAVYTVGEASLRWVAERAAETGLPIHIHLSETAGEVEACVAEHGERPVAYLDRLGVLGPRTIAAHAVHLDDDEIALLAERGVHAAHNPVSNLKLASGGPMRYRALKQAGVNVVIGTDGAGSNNNLDLFEEMKFAALMAKHATGDTTALPAEEALELALANAARAFDLRAGVLEPGALADIVLIDLDDPFLFPGHDLAADLVYAAHGRPVRTTICDGEVLMEDGSIPDEAEIRREVTERWSRLVAG
ncbi:MAG: amidohydrolase family protein, partial [Gemmatimonadota bacterium]